MVLDYLQEVWKDEFRLVSDTAPSDIGEPFSRKSVRAYCTVTFKGLTYGSEYKYGGRAHRHAYIDGRQPVRIAVILHITHTRRDPSLPKLEHTCAIVRKFVRDPDTPAMPWDLQYVDDLSQQEPSLIFD